MKKVMLFFAVAALAVSVNAQGNLTRSLCSLFGTLGSERSRRNATILLHGRGNLPLPTHPLVQIPTNKQQKNILLAERSSAWRREGYSFVVRTTIGI